jgi:hypothetical protein
MARPNRVAQVYGFGVCFVTLVTILAVLPSLVDAAFKLGDPARAGDYRRASLWRSDMFLNNDVPSSFELYRRQQRERERMEAFRFDQMRVRPEPRPVLVPPSPPRSEAELREEYAAAVIELRETRRFQAARFLITYGTLLTVAVVFFVSHWLWVRKLLALDLQAHRSMSPIPGE